MATFPMPRPHLPLGALLALVGARPAVVELTEHTVLVRLGVTFRATVPRACIRSARRDHRPALGLGAHGWRGEWLVNTSLAGLVALDLDPRVRARCLGWPLRVRRLRVSLADPDAFLRALGAPAHHP